MTSSFVRPWAACVLAALLTGCGGSKESPPPAPERLDPQVIFAGRPVDLPPLSCASAILIEPQTNTVLYEQNSHLRRAPASIVKMTLELAVMREIEAGKLRLEDSVRTSAWASRIGGSQVYLAQDETFTVGQLLEAIAIHSANDACVAVAEHVAGTAEGFVQLMNQEAEALKLPDTHYVNVHGLDDEPGEGNYSSAYDISQIGRELIRYPQILEWSSTIQTSFRDGEFVLSNTNHLLGKFPGLDGLKTGYTRKAGFCLCATAERKGLRLISVVMGAEKDRDRTQISARLLGAGFSAVTPVSICKQGDELGSELSIPAGKPKTIRPVAAREITLFVTRPDDRTIKKTFVPTKGLRAPLRAGTEVGRLQISSGDRVLAEVPALAPADVAATGLGAWLRRLFGRG